MRKLLIPIGLLLSAPAAASPKYLHITGNSVSPVVESGSDGNIEPPPADQAGFDRLVLNERFDSETELLSRWSLGLWYQGNLLSNKALSTDGGIGEFVATPESPLRLADLSSWTAGAAGRRTFKYGYFDVRMRWATNPNGNWANFWLLSEDVANVPYSGSWPAYCEIDGVEAYDGGYQSTVHDWLGKNQDTSFSRLHAFRTSGYDPEQWHTYGILWRPGKISFYFDEQLAYTVVSPAVCDASKMMINFGAARHGKYRAVADFDWVRVWQE